MFFFFLVLFFMLKSKKKRRKEAKEWLCDHTAQVSTRPSIGLHSINGENNTQGGQHLLIVYHRWSFLGFVKHILSKIFSPCTSMPSYSAAFLLLCCYIPAYTNYSLHPTDKHTLYLPKAFACFSFSSHLVRWLMKKYTGVKIKARERTCWRWL